MAKNIRVFFENLTDYFLNIIVNVNFFGDGRGHEIFSEKISGP